MPDDTERIYWDANCFASFINQHSDRFPALSAILEGVSASKGRQQVITSVLSKVEVAFSLEEQASRALSQQEEERIALLWADGSVIALVEVHELIVDRARALIRSAMSAGLSLQAADAIHLATAVQVEAKRFDTYDSKLHHPDYAQLTGLAIGEPRADQPILL